MITTTGNCPKCRKKTAAKELAGGKAHFKCECGHRWSETCTVSEFLSGLTTTTQRKKKGDTDVRKDQRR